MQLLIDLANRRYNVLSLQQL